MTKAEKRMYKNMYKERQSGRTSRESARILKKKFGMKLAIEVITKMLTKIAPKNDCRYNYSPEQIRILSRMYRSIENTHKIISYFNRKNKTSLTYHGLTILMCKLGVKKGRRNGRSLCHYTTKQELEIIEEYRKGSTTIKLALKYGFKTPKSISDILKKHGKKARDQAFERANSVPYADFSFAKLDSEFKAYYVGLLLSDGYRTRGFIGLQMADEDVIRFVSRTLGVKYLTIPISRKMTKPMYRVCIYGKERCQQVERFGIVPKKSLIIGSPELNNDEYQYIPYILRGLLDGDGWVRKDGKEFYWATASANFAFWIYNELCNLGMQKLNINFVPNGSAGIWFIRTGLQNNVGLLKDIIYDKPFGMQRKYNRIYQIQDDVQRL